jgi:fatty acid desaturase
VGHDCAHRSFSTNRLLEDIVGTLMFMPLIFPYEPWRIKHNVHHAHTNKCAPPHIYLRPTLLLGPLTHAAKLVSLPRLTLASGMIRHAD